MRRLPAILRGCLIVYLSGLLLVAGGSVAAMKLMHVRLLAVQTGSMAPAFRPGDAVLSQAVPAGQLQIGQVVSYVSPLSGGTISHRIVAIDPARLQLTTRGDALSKPDTPILQTAVTGRVRAVLPKAGTLMTFIRRPIGLTLFIYLPALAIFASELQRLSRHYSRRYYRLATFR